MKKLHFAFLGIFAILFSLFLSADEGRTHRPPMMDNEAFKAAFDKCSSTYGRPEPRQRPSEEFEKCMTDAGFERPKDRGNQNGEHHPPPVQDRQEGSAVRGV